MLPLSTHLISGAIEGKIGRENPNLIDKEEYQKLVDAHVMFKDMDADPYLKSAGKKSLFVSLSS